MKHDSRFEGKKFSDIYELKDAMDICGYEAYIFDTYELKPFYGIYRAEFSRYDEYGEPDHLGHLDYVVLDDGSLMIVSFDLNSPGD